jgi:hypothetical protein
MFIHHVVLLQGGHPMFRNLPGARGNMGGYGRGMGPGGRVITGATLLLLLLLLQARQLQCPVWRDASAAEQQ